MRRKKIDLRLYIPQTLEPPEDFIAFVRHYCDTLPDYLPEKWGYWEPYKQVFDKDNLQQLIPLEGKAIGADWKRISKPKMQGGFKTIYRGDVGKTHAGLWLEADLSAPVETELIHYLLSASVRFAVDFAFIDTYTDAYEEIGLANDSTPTASWFVFHTHTLRRWLPDVFWGTVFGPPYVRLIGKDKLLTAPAFKVQELGDEIVYLQLSESLKDLHADFDAVQRVREKVKAHLDNNIFFDPAALEGHVYNTPHFQLPD